VAKTNDSATVDVDAGVADYAKAFDTMKGIGSYITVKVGDSFQEDRFVGRDLVQARQSSRV